MNKRGQFFLIAALVIVALIAGLATVYNAAKSTSTESSIYDLSDEISFEGSQVLASGIFNARTEQETTQNLLNITEYYAKTTPDSELLVVYGNPNNLQYTIYTNNIVGTIAVETGGAPLQVVRTGRLSRSTGSINANSPTVQIRLSNDAVYTFHIKPGSQFYIVLKKQSESESYVAVPGNNQPTFCQNLDGRCHAVAQARCQNDAQCLQTFEAECTSLYTQCNQRTCTTTASCTFDTDAVCTSGTTADISNCIAAIRTCVTHVGTCP